MSVSIIATVDSTKEGVKLSMLQSRATKFRTVTPDTFAAITVLQLPRCCSLHANRRQRQATVRFEVYSRVRFSQSGTCFMSPFWGPEF